MFTTTVQSMLKNRVLIWELALRELRIRHQGLALGYLWMILRPFIETLAYVVVVGLIMRARLTEGGSRFEYAIYVLGGMVPWQVISRTLAEAPSLIRDRMDLVKQVIYPVETLPLNSLLVSSISASVSLGIYLLLALLTGSLHWTVILLPVPLVLLGAFVIGVSWVFMFAGVILKDLREVVALVLGMMAYLSPVVATREMVGSAAWQVILLNPLSHIVLCFRDVFQGQWHAASWLIFLVLASISFIGGGYTVARARLHINEYI